MPADTTMRQLIGELEAARAALLDDARTPAIAKLAGRGKLSARTRIARLVDKDSFSEIGALVAGDDEDATAVRAKSPADGVVTGTALIDGRAVMVVAQDFSVFGGSSGVMGSAKAWV